MLPLCFERRTGSIYPFESKLHISEHRNFHDRGGGMKSIQIANAFILRHGSDIDITNLVLNKLVYFTQVESLRETGKPLFEDKIEACPTAQSRRTFITLSESMGATGFQSPRAKPQKTNRLYPLLTGRQRNTVFLRHSILWDFLTERTPLGRTSTRRGKASKSPTMTFSLPRMA